MYICKAGHIAIRKARQGKKGVAVNQINTYFFDIEKCKHCQYREGCYKDGAKSKNYLVSIKSGEHTEQAKFKKEIILKKNRENGTKLKKRTVN